MSLDGIMFYKLSKEFEILKTGKINKIQEISDDEYLFTVRKNKENYKLFISVSPNYPRINLTNDEFSFPYEPKSFTMLLRKHFDGAVINDIYSHETDRIMIFETSKYNELGDFENKKLILEILGRYSNLIITSDDVIIDAYRHIGVSEMRSILPNSDYTYPSNFNRINPMLYTLDELKEKLQGVETYKDLASRVLGLSKSNAMLAFESKDFVKSLYEIVNENQPYLEENPKKDINYTSKREGIKYDSYSSLVDDFYKKSSKDERIKQKTDNILSFITKQIKKNESKLSKLELEIKEAKEAEKYKIFGELLLTSDKINQKLDKVEVFNYYTGENIEIKLDEKYYVKENSNLFFKKYKKSKNTISHATEEIEKTKNEIEYFSLLKAQIETTDLLEDVLQIQDELIDNKYIISHNDKRKKKKKLDILTFNINGFTVYVGKNNIQNDYVTNTLGSKEDLWFHVKDAPGSHVLLKKDKDYTEDEIRFCANLAAYYSTFKDSSSVPVNYTKIRNIKKIPGKRNCFVSIKGEKTIYIDPEKIITK